MYRIVGIQDPVAPRHIAHDPNRLTSSYWNTREK